MSSSSRCQGDPVPAQADLTRIDLPSSIDVAAHTHLRRRPVRPVDRRGPDFETAFDDTTLFFDAFWTMGGRHILLIGPPLLDLLPLLSAGRLEALPSGSACPFRIRTLDRHDRVIVDAPPGTTALRLTSPLGCFEIAVGENFAHAFAGRRVLLTLQKDNPIGWVLDWVRYHRDRHGADAVLVYDNGSTAYRPEALRAALAGLDGIASTRVVSWPFKYGPQGLLTGGWDSDYCQLGALEHARWRYLAGASSVLNGDVDELVVSEGGHSVFAATEASRAGLLRYDGAWIMGIAGRDPPAGPDIRHRDYATRLRPRLRWSLRGRADSLTCFVKWTVVPTRCPDAAQWCVHRVGGWAASHLKTGRFGFRHFRQINTQWKYDRTVLEPFDPLRHMADAALADALEGVRWTA